MLDASSVSWAVEAAVQVAHLLCKSGHRAFHHKVGDDLPNRKGPHGKRGNPSSASHAVSCSEELTYTMRPSPTQPCAAADMGQCSPEV